MKRTKRLYLLLGVLAVVCAATFAVSKYEEHKELIANSDEVILSLDTDTVTSLSWEYDSTQLSFHKGDGWVYNDDESFPVDEEKISGLLAQFQEFGVSFRIDDVEDLGQYGLDDPLCTIQITADDKDYNILLGDYSTMDSERYVSIGDGKVYLVKYDPLDDFDVALSDMIDHDETPSFSDVANITFSGKESYEIAYEEESTKTYCDEDVYFTEQDGNTLPLDTSLVKDYLQTISGLKLTDYISYNATEEELQACGLDDPDLTVQVEYTTTDEDDQEVSNNYTLHIGYDEAGEDLPLLNAATDAESSSGVLGEDEENKTTVFIRVGESQIIYKLVGETSEELLTVSANTFRHRRLFPADLDIVTQVDITLEDTDYTLISEQQDDEQVWSYQEKEVSIGEFDSALAALRADSFTQDKPDQKEEISLTLYLENESFPQVKIALYRYDGDKCLALVDGEPQALVSRASVVNLIEAVHGFVLGGEDGTESGASAE